MESRRAHSSSGTASAICPSWWRFRRRGAPRTRCVATRCSPESRRRKCQRASTRSIALLGLDEHRRKLIKQLSKGNLQRVGLAQALLCDERSSSSTSRRTGSIRCGRSASASWWTSLRRPDRAIFIASHNLDELQRVSDRVAIIDRGRLQRVVDISAVPAADAMNPYRIIVLGRRRTRARRRFPRPTCSATVNTTFRRARSQTQ